MTCNGLKTVSKWLARIIRPIFNRITKDSLSRQFPLTACKFRRPHKSYRNFPASFRSFNMENIEEFYTVAADFVAKNTKDIEKAGKVLAIGAAVYYTVSVSMMYYFCTPCYMKMLTVCHHCACRNCTTLTLGHWVTCLALFLVDFQSIAKQALKNHWGLGKQSTEQICAGAEAS